MKKSRKAAHVAQATAASKGPEAVDTPNSKKDMSDPSWPLSEQQLQPPVPASGEDLAGALADQRLVERCLAGDERAWEQLYQECHPRLVRAIKLLLGPDAGDSHLVDEMAARVWYALLRDGGRLLASYDVERDARLGAFLMGLARIEIMRHTRSERRRRSYEFIGGRRILAEGRVPEWQVATMMEEFSASLNSQERRFLEEFLLDAPQTEDGEEIGPISPSSIWQRRHRLREKLKAFFSDL
jgi:DNA-directed RNA polymerase specialized sigma24 family protein